MQAAGQRLREHVAREPALGVARDPLAHQLERDDGARLLEDEPLEVAERAVAAPREPGLRGAPRRARRPAARARGPRVGDARARTPAGSRRCSAVAAGAAASGPLGASVAAANARAASGSPRALEHRRAAADRLGDQPHDLVEPALLEHEPLEPPLDRRAAPQHLVLLVDEAARTRVSVIAMNGIS